MVTAAAVVTWVAATGTAAFTFFLTAGLLLTAGPVLAVFDSGSGDPRWFLAGAAAVLVLGGC